MIFLLAQRFTVTDHQATAAAGAAAAVMMMLCCTLTVVLLTMIPMIIGMWMTFTKAGEPGWASLIPIYNVMILAKIAGKEEAYGLLVLIPLVGIVFAIIILIELCKRFDQGGGFVVGLILLPFVFWPILGMGQARYLGRNFERTRGYDSVRRVPRRFPNDEY